MGFRDLTSKVLDHCLSVFEEKEKVKYRPLSGGTFTIRGIFDETWKEVDPETDVILSSTQPNLGIKLDELGSIKPLTNDTLIVRNEEFRVTDVLEDGQGGATLFLHRIE